MTEVAVVTGASGGIGRAVATAFGARGATVALLARGAAGLRGAAEDVRAGGGTPMMPAVNTPQLSWVLSRVPHHAQPVAPIYQPEFGARGVVYAADHRRRREYRVGTSTMGTLAANTIAPGLLDRHLGKTGFSGAAVLVERSRR